MFTEPAELYDAIYFGFKDYEAEADRIAALLRSLHPGCRPILAVACGTGEHARLLAQRHGFEDAGAADFRVGADRQTDRILVAPVAVPC